MAKGKGKGAPPAAAAAKAEGVDPGLAPLLAAKSREDFVEEVIAHFGGVGKAAEAFGVTGAAVWHWASNSLSVEAAVTIAEAVGLPYEAALRWADRRLGPKKGGGQGG